MGIISKQFSDERISIITMRQYFKLTNSLSYSFDRPFVEMEEPCEGTFYKLTSSIFMILEFESLNMLASRPAKLKSISVAYRDGVTEYELMDKRIKNLSEKGKIPELLKRAKEIKKKIPKYKEPQKGKNSSFEKLITCEMNGDIESDIAKKYVVLDVETNGINAKKDDLLSISIYDPEQAISYDRFLPLDLQPTVLTGWKNGIRDERLVKEVHLNQREIDNIISFFKLKERTILVFGGGINLFDKDFVVEYCKRHKLVGFENLSYLDIKKEAPKANIDIYGKLTKDNLCRILGLSDVNCVHSGHNDCILEWELFKKLRGRKLFFVQNELMEYRDGYIVPTTLIKNDPRILRFANITIPNIVGSSRLLFTQEITLPQRVINKLIPATIFGNAIEKMISNRLNAIKQDNSEFLFSNKNKLGKLGEIGTKINYESISEKGIVYPQEDNNNLKIDYFNQVIKCVYDNITPTLDYIEKNVFNGEIIMSQELTISDDGKILALSDLSSNTKVLEIKTYNFVNKKGDIDKDLLTQLYFQKRNRDVFALSVSINWMNIAMQGLKYADRISVKLFSMDVRLKDECKQLSIWDM